jgi:hypothetical protein
MTEKRKYEKPTITCIDMESLAKTWITPVVEGIKMNLSFVMSPNPGHKPCGCPGGHPCPHSYSHY